MLNDSPPPPKLHVGVVCFATTVANTVSHHSSGWGLPPTEIRRDVFGKNNGAADTGLFGAQRKGEFHVSTFMLPTGTVPVGAAARRSSGRRARAPLVAAGQRDVVAPIFYIKADSDTHILLTPVRFLQTDWPHTCAGPGLYLCIIIAYYPYLSNYIIREIITPPKNGLIGPFFGGVIWANIVFTILRRRVAEHSKNRARFYAHCKNYISEQTIN